MRTGRFQKEEVEQAANVEFADLVGYARSEFREGRSEREVLALLRKSGAPDGHQGVVHELYLECLEVSLADRVLETIVKVLGLPIALFIFLRVETTWWAGLGLLGAMALYSWLISLFFHRHWVIRFRRKLNQSGD